MLINLITVLTGIDYGFPATNANTIRTGHPIAVGNKKNRRSSRIEAEFDKVVFVTLCGSAEYYFDVDPKKDIVIQVGPWRQLFFIDNGAGSGVVFHLDCGKKFGNTYVVPSSDDTLMKKLIDKAKSEPVDDDDEEDDTPDNLDDGDDGDDLLDLIDDDDDEDDDESDDENDDEDDDEEDLLSLLD